MFDKKNQPNDINKLLVNDPKMKTRINNFQSFKSQNVDSNKKKSNNNFEGKPVFNNLKCLYDDFVNARIKPVGKV